MTNFKGDYITHDGAKITKIYLTEGELQRRERSSSIRKTSNLIHY